MFEVNKEITLPNWHLARLAKWVRKLTLSRRAWRSLIGILLATGMFTWQARAGQFDEAAAALRRQDYATAFRLFKPLAEAGDPAAQNNLGVLYRNGTGIPEDYTEALKWFRRSAEQGSSLAQYNLGLAYDEGQGVREDKQEAFKWFKLSAEQGDAAAQISLGFMYQEGIGVQREPAEAVKWYKLAADQGNQTARKAMALLSKDLNSFAFIMPTYWILWREKAIDNEQALFRRYSLLIERSNLTEIDSGKTQDVHLLEHPGSFINSMIYNCQRDRRKSDFITIHLPESAHPKSFDYHEWVSRLEVRILADGASSTVGGEYIQGDLFMDANALGSARFLSLLSASRLIFEFGEKNDRVSFAVAEQIGNAKIGSFIREALPMAVKASSSLQFLSGADMLARCSIFKRTGRFR